MYLAPSHVSRRLFECSKPLKFKINNPLSRIRHRKPTTRGRICSQNHRISDGNNLYINKVDFFSVQNLTLISPRAVVQFYGTKVTGTFVSKILQQLQKSFRIVQPLWVKLIITSSGIVDVLKIQILKKLKYSLRFGLYPDNLYIRTT